MIGTENESTLHRQIKELYQQKGDQLETRIGDYVVDIVRNDLLIEIQIGNFTAIRDKLHNLVQKHYTRLVYPIARQKWLVYLNKKDQEIRRRKSPKRGDFTELFNELIRIPRLLNHPNFSVEIIYLQEEEYRCDDGQGSWRRGGISIVDHKLIAVLETVIINHARDLDKIFPRELPSKFTNRDLAQHWDISLHRAQKITYCLRKLECIRKIGNRGRAYLFSPDK